MTNAPFLPDSALTLRDGSDPAAIAEAANRIRAGQLVAFPTETVYGLGADASNDAAVAKIFKAKGRPANHPLIVHVANSAQAVDYAQGIAPFAERLMAAFWPGPLTLILPRRPGIASACAGGQDSIGLRCPAHPVALALIAAAGTGIAGPSANRFGRISPTAALHVQQELQGRVSAEEGGLLILDGGLAAVGIESSIVDCTRGQPVLLRPGMLSRAALTRACGQEVLVQPAVNDRMAGSELSVIQPAPRAPGMLTSHYAPQAPLRLMAGPMLQTALDLLESDAPRLAVYARRPIKSRANNILIRRMPDDAAAAAQQLFATLRAFDAQGVQLIWVENVPETPEWDGVRDRLTRAAAAG